MPDLDEIRVTDCNFSLPQKSRRQTDFSCVIDSNKVGKFHCGDGGGVFFVLFLYGGVLEHNFLLVVPCI